MIYSDNAILVNIIKEQTIVIQSLEKSRKVLGKEKEITHNILSHLYTILHQAILTKL